MGKKDPRVDAYIARASSFARPILAHLRRVVHEGCPDVQETIKWRMPFFIHNGILCGMAAFTSHCAFHFRKSDRIFGNRKMPVEAMGQFGRISSIDDLPNEGKLIGYVRKAARLNEAGMKSPRKARPAEKKKLTIPPDLKSGLQKNAKARKNFEEFSYTHKKEYVEWITGAKRDETRRRRLKTALQWITEGKPQNWKYV